MDNKPKKALFKITLQHFQKHFGQYHEFLKKRYSNPEASAAFIRQHPKEAAKDLHLMIKGGTLFAGLLHHSGLAKYAVEAAQAKDAKPVKKYLTDDPRVQKLMAERYEATPAEQSLPAK